MKKILIYTINDGRFIDSLYHSLGKGFNELGRKVIYCNVHDPDFISNISKIISNEDIDFSIGHNEFGIINAQEQDILTDFYKEKEHVAILDDAPYNIVTNRLFEVECPNLLIAYRDISHLDYLKSIKFKYDIRNYFFMPFGALLEQREASATDKDIDIIFSGMYYGDADRLWRKSAFEKTVIEFFDYVADILENDAVTVDDAVTKALSDTELNIDKETFFPAYMTLYMYAKTYRRNRLVASVVNSGLKLVVCSDTWKNSKVADKLIYSPANSTQEVLNLYKKSKILLQDMAEFNNGSHCRVGDGLLCNSIVVSEYSKFLSENFADSGLLLFNWDCMQNLPQILSSMCSKDKLRNSLIDSAVSKVTATCLPKHSAKRILDAVGGARQGLHNLHAGG